MVYALTLGPWPGSKALGFTLSCCDASKRVSLGAPDALHQLAKQMLDNASFPGSMNGTGLFQTICGLKIREVYENLTK